MLNLKKGGVSKTYHAVRAGYRLVEQHKARSALKSLTDTFTAPTPKYGTCQWKGHKNYWGLKKRKYKQV